MRGYWLSQTFKCMKHYQSAGAQPTPANVAVINKNNRFSDLYVNGVFLDSRNQYNTQTGQAIVFIYTPYQNVFYEVLCFRCDINKAEIENTSFYKVNGVLTGTFNMPSFPPTYYYVGMKCYSGDIQINFSGDSHVEEFIAGSFGSGGNYIPEEQRALLSHTGLRLSVFSILCETGYEPDTVTATIRNPQPGQNPNISLTPYTGVNNVYQFQFPSDGAYGNYVTQPGNIVDVVATTKQIQT